MYEKVDWDYKYTEDNQKRYDLSHLRKQFKIKWGKYEIFDLTSQYKVKLTV